MAANNFSLSGFCVVIDSTSCGIGRIYAAYGGIYICTALIWLKYVDQVNLTRWDMFGGMIVVLGALIIILQPQGLIR